MRADFIHEAKMNAVLDAIRLIIPAELQESSLRKGRLRL